MSSDRQPRCLPTLWAINFTLTLWNAMPEGSIILVIQDAKM